MSPGRRSLDTQLDIKPYVPQLDDRATERTGWFAANVHKVYEVRADGRNR